MQKTVDGSEYWFAAFDNKGMPDVEDVVSLLIVNVCNITQANIYLIVLWSLRPP